MDKRILIPVLLASFLGASSAALADETLNFLGVDQADIFNIQFGNINENVYVGSLLFTSSTDSHPFDLFCVDLNHDIWAGNSYLVDPINTSTLPDGDPIKLAGDIYAAGIGSVTDADHAAAMQIALWEAVAGNDFQITNAPSYIMDWAQNYYAAGTDFTGAAMYYQEIGNDGQSQIGSVPGPAGAMVLLVSTLGGALLKRRR